MSNITDLHAMEILDSRGNPTVEVEITLDSGVTGRAAVPSGGAAGEDEAVELRDGDKRRFGGRGVLKAVRGAEETIFPEIEGMDALDQIGVDQAMIELDGTPNKEKLGANAILAVSLACAHAAAAELEMPLYRYLGGVNAKVLPVPMMNIVNGGPHSDAPMAFQEFMIRPVGAPDFPEALRMGAEVFHAFRRILAEKHLSTAVGDEGGFAPAFPGGAEEALDTILKAVDLAGYRPGDDIRLALDCAAGGFFRDGRYDYRRFEGENAPRRDAAEQTEYLERLTRLYPIDSIEDGMAGNDPEGWKLLTDRLGDRCQLVGDGLFASGLRDLEKGIELGAANAILIQPNRIGTLTETLDVIETAHRAGYAAILSHGSGETEDTSIADLAVAVNAGQIKTGSLSRSDRIAKYNRLLRIDAELGNLACYG